MATAFSHAFAALSIASCFYKQRIPKRVWLLGAAAAIFPDVDVIGFRYGIHYADFWGHRGFTHSLLFAAIVAAAITLIGFRRRQSELGPAGIFAFLFAAAASHGVLDAMTDGGLGVAFFSPFDNSRYFLPWRPVRVSPISVSHFFGPQTMAILKSEFVWIWLPALAFAALVMTVRFAVRDEIRD